MVFVYCYFKMSNAKLLQVDAHYHSTHLPVAYYDELCSILPRSCHLDFHTTSTNVLGNVVYM